MKRFVPRYLDPASRLGEILFGLIMVLTVTLTAGLTVDEGRAGVRQLLVRSHWLQYRLGNYRCSHVHHELHNRA